MSGRGGGVWLGPYFFTPPRPPISTLFPYTTLFRSVVKKRRDRGLCHPARVHWLARFGINAWSLVSRQALMRSEEHTSELQSLRHLVCRLLLAKKNIKHELAFNKQSYDSGVAIMMLH